MGPNCLETSKRTIHQTRGYHRLPTNIRKSHMNHADLCQALLTHTTSLDGAIMSEVITVEVHREELRTMLNDDPHITITQFYTNLLVSDLKAS